ncbi:hypothetical protein ACTQ5K_13680 [Niallia sp. Sow4_A1]|jgi:hypothetical protein|uniref:hypothetical protein n=1 Tax=Bacillaceae TaxID=186817 RepID=UPI0004E19ED6|nr:MULTISPECIES: hypothetical protein [Bacillaceae]MCF2650819.1 hypothetical protein [Niallia circulans]CAI9395993.1 hypothetical protein BACSP_04245 [Bacillus sp. T2.9-1]
MFKKRFVLYVFIFTFLLTGFIIYQKVTDDTYKGMTIIPEQEKDIPLYAGLTPTKDQYIMDGNSWEAIYDYYEQELPKHGWSVEYIGSALEDNDSANDWSGFYSRWRKAGFDGELSLSASYNKSEMQTEVMFDKHQILDSTVWLKQNPESIRIYQNESQQDGVEVKDKAAISEIVQFINSEAYDSKETTISRKHTKLMDLGNLKIKVYYEKEKTIFLQSAKGIKEAKPDPSFMAFILAKGN